MGAGDYTYTPATGSVVTLTLGTKTEADLGRGQRLLLRQYAGIDGADAIKLGASPRAITLTALVESTSESGLRTALEALDTAAVNASPGTLALRGSATTWSNVIMSEPPQYGEHIPLQSDGTTIAQRVTLKFIQLTA